jgi:predicted negative regulator of RcsB-dependent stress response
MATKTIDADTMGDRAQTLLDWTRLNSRWLTIGGVIVVVAAGGYWFYTRSREIQTRNAESALGNARQAMSAGNLPLAQSDLQQVYAKYGSTAAGVQAAMLIAQIDYDAGKNQDGISILQKVSGSGPAAYLESTVRSLEGDGYAQLGKPVDAAKQYAAAAQATQFKNEKAFYQAKAARAYQAAGDTASAHKIWSVLATDPDAKAMATEARVRLGELTARVATK